MAGFGEEQTYPVILELDNADSPAVNISPPIDACVVLKVGAYMRDQ